MRPQTELKREVWIDDVKVVACVLVLLGHLMQALTAAQVVTDGAMYQWFNKTIYYFHVPLFFICSGYLYQKSSCVYNISAWGNNVLKKAITLGIPYFTFMIATWLLKTLFSGAGNNEIDNIVETLFLQPTAPYWYLYTLFFIFLVTFTFNSRKNAKIGLAVASVLKIISLVTYVFDSSRENIPYCISTVLSYEIWFVIGMCLCEFEIKNIQFKKSAVGACIGILFLMLSILLKEQEIRTISFLLGLMACAAVVLIYMDRNTQGKVMAFLSKYTMPIFLMHGFFAAPLRIILLKCGITNAVLHITSGIAISIFGPVIVAWVMKKTKYLEFFIYPGKFIKIGTSKK